MDNGRGAGDEEEEGKDSFQSMAVRQTRMGGSCFPWFGTGPGDGLQPGRGGVMQPYD